MLQELRGKGLLAEAVGYRSACVDLQGDLHSGSDDIRGDATNLNRELLGGRKRQNGMDGVSVPDKHGSNERKQAHR